MKKRTQKIALLLAMISLLTVFFSVNVFAAGSPATTESVASVVEKVSKDAAGQIKEIVNKVVFPVIDLILVVLLFVKGGMLYFQYNKKGGQLDFVPVAIIFVGLLISLTAPLYIWRIIGI